MKNASDTLAFRQMMGSFATGVAVVTARNAELGAFGLTINSFTSVSLHPQLVLFCLDGDAFLYSHFRRAKSFAVNILAQGQEDISRHFASRHHHPKPKNMWDRPQKDCPILRGTLGWILCHPQAFHKAGDHTILVGKVVDFHKRAVAKEPLLYFHGRYRALKSLGKVTSGARK
ncbi:MAG: flavin reductase family protein [Alphaproteobacteria bacterium]|nr:flavin reductase family protein [Alphaproteobacteria bacterium]